MSVWLNHARRSCPDMVYMFVPELHTDGVSFHFHGVMSNADGLNFIDSGLVDKHGKKIYNIGNYKLGWTTATRVEDNNRVASYICKYITKELCAVTKNKKRYWSSRNCKRPVIEDMMIESGYNYELLCMAYMQECDESHIKRIETEHGTITYIDRPIYSTNTCFSNRCG